MISFDTKCFLGVKVQFLWILQQLTGEQYLKMLRNPCRRDTVKSFPFLRGPGSLLY